jgi:hypothetical protein
LTRPVNGVRHRLARLDLVEWRPAQIELGEVDCRKSFADAGLKFSGLDDGGDVVLGQIEIRDEVDLARTQAGDAARRLGKYLEDEAVEIGRMGAPIAIKPV